MLTPFGFVGVTQPGEPPGYIDETTYMLWNGDGQHPEIPDPGSAYLYKHNPGTGEYDQIFDASPLFSQQFGAANISADGKFIAVCGSGLVAGIEVVDVDGNALVPLTDPFPGALSTSFGISFSPDGSMLALMYYDGIDGNHLLVYQTSDMTIISDTNVSTQASPGDVRWSPDGSKVVLAQPTATSSGRAVVCVYETATWTLLKEDLTDDAVVMAASQADGVGFTGDGSMVFALFAKTDEDPTGWRLFAYDATTFAQVDHTGTDIENYFVGKVSPDYGVSGVYPVGDTKAAVIYVSVDSENTLAVFDLVTGDLVREAILNATSPTVGPVGLGVSIDGTRFFAADGGNSSDGVVFSVDTANADGPLTLATYPPDQYFYGWRTSTS